MLRRALVLVCLCACGPSTPRTRDFYSPAEQTATQVPDAGQSTSGTTGRLPDGGAIPDELNVERLPAGPCPGAARSGLFRPYRCINLTGKALAFDPLTDETCERIGGALGFISEGVDNVCMLDVGRPFELYDTSAPERPALFRFRGTSMDTGVLVIRK